MRSLTTLTIATMLAAVSVAGVMAQTVVTPTINYAAGATATKDNKLSNYGYVTGNGNGDNEFDVLDYTTTATPGATAISNVAINLFDEGYTASDSVGGGISFYVEPDTTTADGANGSTGALTFDAAQPTGVDTGTANGFTTAPILIGSSTVTVPATTTANYKYSFSYAVTPGSALSNYLAAELASGGAIRVLATPNSTTDPLNLDIFGYASKSGGNAPAISLTTAPAAVPEASTTISFGLLLALGLGGFAVARRRKAA